MKTSKEIGDFFTFGKMIKPEPDDQWNKVPYPKYCLKVVTCLDEYDTSLIDEVPYFVEVWDDQIETDLVGINFRHADKAVSFFNKCKKLKSLSKIMKLIESVEVKRKKTYQPYAGLEILKR